MRLQLTYQDDMCRINLDKTQHYLEDTIMSLFLNYNNGSLTVNSHRNVNAEVTTIEDIYDAIQENREETLVASLDQNFNYDPNTKIATFSGICYNGDTGFEICIKQEAHNIESEEAGRLVWGLDEDLAPSI